MLEWGAEELSVEALSSSTSLRTRLDDMPRDPRLGGTALEVAEVEDGLAVCVLIEGLLGDGR